MKPNKCPLTVHQRKVISKDYFHEQMKFVCKGKETLGVHRTHTLQRECEDKIVTSLNGQKSSILGFIYLVKIRSL